MTRRKNSPGQMFVCIMLSLLGGSFLVLMYAINTFSIEKNHLVKKIDEKNSCLNDIAILEQEKTFRRIFYLQLREPAKKQHQQIKNLLLKKKNLKSKLRWAELVLFYKSAVERSDRYTHYWTSPYSQDLGDWLPHYLQRISELEERKKNLLENF